MEFNFTDKVVLVTGASAGIGEATAILFAKFGAKLSIVGRDEENLKRVSKICEEQKKVQPLEIVADLSTDEGCELVAKQTLDKFGRVDVLVNNAGVGARTSILHGDMSRFDVVFSTNVRGVMNLTRLLAPSLVQSKGNVVNVSSISGSIASVGSLPYSMSKAAMDQFSKCIALELADKNVRVNTVSPGLTYSKFVKRLTGYTDEQYMQWMKAATKMVPMGRPCDPEHIAKTIVFLASEHAELITGALIQVDGGVSLGSVINSDVMKQQMK